MLQYHLAWGLGKFCFLLFTLDQYWDLYASRPKSLFPLPEKTWGFSIAHWPLKARYFSSSRSWARIPLEAPTHLLRSLSFLRKDRGVPEFLQPLSKSYLDPPLKPGGWVLTSTKKNSFFPMWAKGFWEGIAPWCQDPRDPPGALERGSILTKRKGKKGSISKNGGSGPRS